MKEIRQEQEMIEEQIELRRALGMEERFTIVNRGRHPVYGKFEVTSTSGRSHMVRIRSITERLNSCTCSDYRANTLRVCKHIEGALSTLKKEFADQWDDFISKAPDVGRIYIHHAEKTTVRVMMPLPKGRFLRPLLTRCFDAEGVLLGARARSLSSLIHEIGQLPKRNRDRILVEQEVLDHLAHSRDLERVKKQKRWFLNQVTKEARSLNVLSRPLFNYQEDGVLHLTFGRRVLLADDMGLGKTIQAIAAAALLKQLRDIQRVLIVCPTSLKHQWAREIRRLTSLSVQVIEGAPAIRRDLYQRLGFFNIVNYESVRFDEEEIAGREFDLVILDEAQRIKNWRTRTAAGVMRLRAPRAFVLTGVPLEDRWDELYWMFTFIDPTILGPRFRFKQRFHEVRQRASGSYKLLGYKNLDELRQRLAPYMKRRRRTDVILDLPRRIDNTFFVEMTEPQLEAHGEYERTAARWMAKARRAPLTSEERRELLGCLSRMHVICNALALHDPGISAKDREKTSPKLRELREILSDSLTDANRKAVIFSQWTGMLELITPVLDKLNMGWIKLTSQVPPASRDDFIKQFFDDPMCKVCLSTDAGGEGLNLQAASLVINMDPPWTPATLGRRIARVQRPGQPHSINVVNLVARGAIEERMLDALIARKTIFDAAPNEDSAVADLSYEDADPDVVQRLEMLLGSREATPELLFQADRTTGREDADAPETPTLLGFSDILLNRFPGRILLIRKAPQLPNAPSNQGVLVVADREPARLRRIMESLLNDYFGDAPTPDLLLMEHEGYKALATLTGDLLDQAAESVTAYRSLNLHSPFREDNRKALEKRLRRANEGFDTADGRLKLASVMLEGGFPGEMSGPVRQALGWSLSTHLFLVMEDEPGESLPSPRRVEAILTAEGRISKELSARLERVRVLTEPADEGEADAPPAAETAKGFIRDIRELIDMGREQIAREALGEPKRQ